jgi:uncharacterized membrane protein YagU involved in acid resistance
MTAIQKIKTGFTAGLVAAALDISGAIIVFAYILKLSTPQKILQSVAAGALGKEAYLGGWQIAIVGLLFHTFIATSFAFFYVLIYPAVKKIIKSPLISGILYGCFVWCVMNLGVLMLILGKQVNPKYIFANLSILIIMVGIPIALLTNKYFKQQQF